MPVPRDRVVREVCEAEQARWLAENEHAIDQYNAFVELRGGFGDDFRQS